jgi:hypothetical protein
VYILQFLSYSLWEFEQDYTTLAVSVPPTVHIQQADPYIVRPGESFSLHCAVGGNPVPTVKWFKDVSGLLAYFGLNIYQGAHS